MATERDRFPAVMTFAGLDPTGGAGLQADIESIVSMGGHALPVITAIAVQDTIDVKTVTPVSTGDLVGQARAVLEDVEVSAFKIGLLGSVEIAEAVYTILDENPSVPVVLDPVCASGAGTALADDEIAGAMISLLCPVTTVLTPNSPEARRLAPTADSLAAAAQQLLSYGCGAVLVTGAHEPGPEVVNHFYADRRLVESFRFERLHGSYHGSGCTLAAAIATLLAHGVEPVNAVREAQQFTHEALRGAYRIGRGQLVPDRLHWARSRGTRR